LTHDAAVKWINAEQGVNGNVLGVTYRDASGQHLYQYPSQEAGIRAAVSLIKTSGNYTGIRASLGQSVTTQLQAIAASPWNAPSHYRSGGTFGVSISGFMPPTTTASTAQLVSTSSGANLATFLGLDPNTPIDASTIKMIDDKIKAKEASGAISHDIAQNLLQLVGGYGVAAGHGATSTKLGTVLFDPITGNQPLAAPYQALKDALNVGGDVAAFLFDPDNWRYFGAIVIGVPLALFGFYLLAGVKTGGPELSV
jgi:hypothetical protein